MKDFVFYAKDITGLRSIYGSNFSITGGLEIAVLSNSIEEGKNYLRELVEIVYGASGVISYREVRDQKTGKFLLKGLPFRKYKEKESSESGYKGESRYRPGQKMQKKKRPKGPIIFDTTPASVESNPEEEKNIAFCKLILISEALEYSRKEINSESALNNISLIDTGSVEQEEDFVKNFLISYKFSTN